MKKHTNTLCVFRL